MSSCGAVVGGVSLDRVDVTTQAIIQGVVSKNGAPAQVGYVRLLDATDEFTAEVPVSTSGEFRFFAAPGTWTVVSLVPGGSARTSVQAELGKIADIEIHVDSSVA
jgi:hypothetical protein